MKETSPYFRILVKQKANLRNNDEAERVIDAISICLRANLGANATRVLKLLPVGKVDAGRKFYLSMRKHRDVRFQYGKFLAGVMGLLNLTDTIEAEQYVYAYFSAAIALMGEHDRVMLGRLLPQELPVY